MSSTNRKTPDGAQAVKVSFAAIDPRLEINVVPPTERESRPGGMVWWGEANRYPDYLWSLYREVPTLQSIVDGNVDYVAGDSTDIRPLAEGYAPGVMNRRGDLDAAGRPAEVYWLDMRYVRTDKECTRFWYSEKWGQGGRRAVVYPAFRPGLDWASLDDAGRAEHASSVLYVRGSRRQTYPVPRYGSAVKACEMERHIDDFHLNSLANGFYGSFIVNFNNGVPEDAVKEQVERDFTEKFAGAANAGRVMFSWNRDMTARTTMETPKVEDFGEKYGALAARARQEIFTAFRANPNLFGIPTEGNGFANEQYEESFRLYNRTMIEPMQDTIRKAYETIYGAEGVLAIAPLTLGAAQGGPENG